MSTLARASRGYLDGCGYTLSRASNGYLVLCDVVEITEPIKTIPGRRIGMSHDPTLYFEYNKEDLKELILQEDEEIIILIKAFLRSL